MKNEIAISSSCFPAIGGTLEAVFAFLAGNDFSAVELNYRVCPLDASLTLELLKKYEMRVVSLHNTCSYRPEHYEPDDPYGDELASLDEDKRRWSVEKLIGTAEMARRLGAQAIVIHSGYVDSIKFEPRYERILEATKKNSIDGTVRALAAELYEERLKAAEPHLEQLVKSLREVCPRFPELKFGLETRYHLHSIPVMGEVEQIIEGVGAENLGYWHDYGHAQVMENLGLVPHREWLERYRDVLVGVHLHAIEHPFHDHLAGSPGELKVDMLRELLTPSCIKVAEPSPENTPDRVVRFVKALQDALDP